jgi:hypothetical protein
MWSIGGFGVLIGFASGVAATLAWVGRSPPDPGEAAPEAAELGATTRSAPAQVPVCPPCGDGDDPARHDVEALLAAIQKASDPLSGPKPEWSTAPGYQADTVRTTLEAAFPGVDIQLDCQEFPCIGVIDAGPDAPDELADDIDAHGMPGGPTAGSVSNSPRWASKTSR